MAVSLENSTISMILMVPYVHPLVQSTITSTALPAIENFEGSCVNESSSSLKYEPIFNRDKKCSVPVYHGSLIRIEQYKTDQNTSDLIVRVPNFQHSTFQSGHENIQRQTRTKRRAPLCPLLENFNQKIDTSSSNTCKLRETIELNLNQSQDTSKNILTTGLRSIGRAFNRGCKSKQPTGTNNTTLSSALPDIEVMVNKIDLSFKSKKDKKNEHISTNVPKLMAPKISFNKENPGELEVKRISSLDFDTLQIDSHHNQSNRTLMSTMLTTQHRDVPVGKSDFSQATVFSLPSVKLNHASQEISLVSDGHGTKQQDKSIKLHYEVDRQLAAISELFADIPLSNNDTNSLSTHRYSTISANAVDNRVSMPNNQPVTERSSTVVFHTPSPNSEQLHNHIAKAFVKNMTPVNSRSFRIQTSLLRPDISVIRAGTSKLVTGSSFHVSAEKSLHENVTIRHNIPYDSSKPAKENCRITHYQDDRIDSPDAETFTECHKVTCQIDSQHQNEREENTVDNSLIRIDTGAESMGCSSLSSTLVPWFSSISINDYERIGYDNNIPLVDHQNVQSERVNSNAEDVTSAHDAHNNLCNINSKTKSLSNENSSQETDAQRLTAYLWESNDISSLSDVSSRQCTSEKLNFYDNPSASVDSHSSKDLEYSTHRPERCLCKDKAVANVNDEILCMNNTPVINEDYTVIVQIINADQYRDPISVDNIANDVYEEFKSQVDEQGQ